MGSALSTDELTVVTALNRTGLSMPVATLAVVMAVREHARPRKELLDIVRQYQGLEDPRATEQAISELTAIGWIRESESYGRFLVHQALDLRDLIASRLGDSIISTKLREMRLVVERGIQIMGPMNDKIVYETFFDRLRSARYEICLPMLATTPNLAAVPIIQERARQGVYVRVLLGSPGVVGTLRGKTMEAASKDAISGWRRNARATSNMSVRIADNVEDVELSSSMLVDGRLLRLDIYDPRQQRSLEGVLIEVDSPAGLEPNIIRIFRRYFDEAWTRAKPSPWSLAILWWYFEKGWQLFFFIAFLLLAVLITKDPWSRLFTGVAGGLLLAMVVASWKRISGFVRRLFERR